MSDNDLSTLLAALALKLRDETYATWDAVEMEDLLTWSVDSLYPRYSWEVDSQVAAYQITLAEDQFYYAVPTGLRTVSRVDLVGPTDSAGDRLEYGSLDGSTWELQGNLEEGEGWLHMQPTIVNTFIAGYLRLVGYAAYDLVNNLVPDRLVPLVLAQAAAEAYRRISVKRVRFEAWLTTNQGQNVSVNELIQLTNEADAEIRTQKAAIQRTWMKPVPGRQG